MNPVARTIASKSLDVPSVKVTVDPFTSEIVGLSVILPSATALRKSLESVMPGVKKKGIQSAYSASNDPNHAGMAEQVLASKVGAPCVSPLWIIHWCVRTDTVTLSAKAHASCAMSEPDAAPVPTTSTRASARSLGSLYSDECTTAPSVPDDLNFSSFTGAARREAPREAAREAPAPADADAWPHFRSGFRGGERDDDPRAGADAADAAANVSAEERRAATHVVDL